MADKDDELARAELKRRTKSWLQTQGYPLEMEVAELLRSAGFETRQSDYYLDEDDKKHREIDVVASRTEWVGGMDVRVTFVIECKLSRKWPWVLFTSDTTLAPPLRVALRSSSELGAKWLIKAHRDEVIRTSRLFGIASRPAYGLTEAHPRKDAPQRPSNSADASPRSSKANQDGAAKQPDETGLGPDRAYRALMTVAKAADARVRAVNASRALLGPTCEVVFPVLVIDGFLFEFYRDSASGEVLQDVDGGTLLWKNPLGGRSTVNMIEILRKEAVADYVHLVARDIEALFSATKDVLELIGREASSE